MQITRITASALLRRYSRGLARRRELVAGGRAGRGEGDGKNRDAGERTGYAPTLLSGGFGAKIEDLAHSLILEALLCSVH
jgi:hypothetical protein